MRGVPKHPVKCEVCGKKQAAPKDRRCRACRFKGRAPWSKYHWTPEQEEILRRAYAGAVGRKQLHEAISYATAQIGFPRYIIRLQAQRMKLTRDLRRPWTEAEREGIRDMAGEFSVQYIARVLGRAHETVAAQMERMKISRRVMNGYTLTDLCMLFGVTSVTVHKWIVKGWMATSPTRGGRFPEEVVLRFIRNHPEQYSLRRVDEELFKGLLFAGADCYRPLGRVQVRSANRGEPPEEMSA